jgi:aspartate aminotransferase-like enzyme
MIDEVLTMIPGPTPVHERILRQLARPTSSHQAPQFVESYRRCLEDLCRVVFTDSAQPFIVAGSGTLAMEMALVNVVGPEEKILVLSQGFFGDRWAQIAQAFGIPFDRVQADWGQIVPPEELERRLAGTEYAAVAMTHVDTSTGAAAPVESYGKLLRNRRELVILDGVCATAGVEQRFDAWGIDVLLTGAQKAFGAPPGVALLVASQRALDKRRSLSNVPAYTADFLRWLPIMENPALYFSTPPVNQIVAIREATAMILEEGLERRFHRHARMARAIRAGLAALDLTLFTDPRCRANTLSVVLYPNGIDDTVFRSEMARRGVVVAAGLGPIAGRAFRVGHMGNIGEDEVCRTLHAAEATLAEMGHEVRRGSALSAAAPLFAE